MPGNGEFELQNKGIDGGKGAKEGGFDSLIPELSKDTGPAKSPADGGGMDKTLTPDGQRLVG